MVRYQEALDKSRVVEWRNYYVGYGLLKDFLHELVHDPSSFHERFIRELSNNVTRLSCFYDLQVYELVASSISRYMS